MSIFCNTEKGIVQTTRSALMLSCLPAILTITFTLLGSVFMLTTSAPNRIRSPNLTVNAVVKLSTPPGSCKHLYFYHFVIPVKDSRQQRPFPGDRNTR